MKRICIESIILFILLTSTNFINNCNSKKDDNNVEYCEPYGPFFNEPEFSIPEGSLEIYWRLLDKNLNERYSFVEGEKIILDIKLYNKHCNTNGFLWFTNKFDYAEDYLYFEIFDEKGNKVFISWHETCKIEKVSYHIPDEDEELWFVKINNFSYYSITKVLNYGGEVELGLCEGWAKYCYCSDFSLEAGKYKIVGYYRNMDRIKIQRLIDKGVYKRFKRIDLNRMWMGKLNFKPIEFEVISYWEWRNSK